MTQDIVFWIAHEIPLHCRWRTSRLFPSISRCLTIWFVGEAWVIGGDVLIAHTAVRLQMEASQKGDKCGPYHGKASKFSHPVLIIFNSLILSDTICSVWSKLLTCDSAKFLVGQGRLIAIAQNPNN